MRMLSAGAIVIAGSGAFAAGSEPLVLIRTMALPQVEGRIDHLALDREKHRLFIAALGNNSVEVLDVSSGIRFKSLPGFHEPQGIGVVPLSKQIVVANGDGGETPASPLLS